MPQTRDTVRTLIEDFLTSREMIPPTWDTTRLRDPTSEGHHVHTVRDTCEEYPTWGEYVARLCPTPLAPIVISSPSLFIVLPSPASLARSSSFYLSLLISPFSFFLAHASCSFLHFPLSLTIPQCSQLNSNLYFSSSAFAAMSSSFSPSLSIFAISKLYHTLSAFLALELFI